MNSVGNEILIFGLESLKQDRCPTMLTVRGGLRMHPAHQVGGAGSMGRGIHTGKIVTLGIGLNVAVEQVLVLTVDDLDHLLKQILVRYLNRLVPHLFVL